MKQAKHILNFALSMSIAMAALLGCAEESSNPNAGPVSPFATTKPPKDTTSREPADVKDSSNVEDITSSSSSSQKSSSSSNEDRSSSSSSEESSSSTHKAMDYSKGHAMNKRIGKGINFGNAFDATCESCWGGGPIEEHFVTAVAEAGFNSVRLPVRWDTHADKEEPFTVDPDYLARVKEVVGWINNVGLVCIINMHHHSSFLEDVEDPGIANKKPNLENAEYNLTRVDSIWSQIAAYFADIPNEKLVFELFNEPRDGVSADLHNQMIARTYPIIRASNPGRTIMYGSTNYNSYAGIRYLELPEDGNIIFTPHYYLPAAYTLQGENYRCPDKPATWGYYTEKVDMARTFEDMQKKIDQYYPGGLPVNIGEFGATECGGVESREAWVKNFVKLAKENNYSWAYWALTNVGGFELYDKDTQQWTDSLTLNALIKEPEDEE